MSHCDISYCTSATASAGLLMDARSSGDSSDNLLPNSIAALSCAALASPIACCSINSFMGARCKPDNPPNLFNRRWTTSTALSPTTPTCSRMAINSALVKACGPTGVHADGLIGAGPRFDRWVWVLSQSCAPLCGWRNCTIKIKQAAVTFFKVTAACSHICEPIRLSAGWAFLRDVRPGSLRTG
jgi:hypothetical protein